MGQREHRRWGIDTAFEKFYYRSSKKSDYEGNGSWGYGFKEVSFSVKVITICCPLSKRNFLNWTRDRNSISIINKVKVAESCPTLCNLIDQNTGVGSLYHLQGIFPTQGSTQVSRNAGRFFTSWATREAQEYWSGQPIPSPADLPDPGIEQGVSCIAGGFFTNWVTREAPLLTNLLLNLWYWNGYSFQKKKEKRKKVKLYLNFVQLGFHEENAKTLLLKYHLHSLVL